MPIQLSQRPLTDEERARLLTFREQPRPLVWLGGWLLFCLCFAGCSGAILTQVIQPILEIKAPARPYGFGIAAAVVFILAIWFANNERRARRRRAENRRRIAAHNQVEVATIDFDRLWTVDGASGGESVVLEARPFILVHLPVPKDEDEHAAIVKGLNGPYDPEPIFNGTFPRRRIIIEHARGPEPRSPVGRFIVVTDSFLLTITWTGDRMQPAGKVGPELIPQSGWWTDDDFGPPLGLVTLVTSIPHLARGPWMKDIT